MTVLNTLSPRENQVLALWMTGLRWTDIAKELSISDKTVNTYKTSAMKKLKTKNDALLACALLEGGM